MSKIFEILNGSTEEGSYLHVKAGDSIYKYKLLHDKNVSMSEGQQFITTSEKFSLPNINQNIQISLYFGKIVDIIGKTKIVIRSKLTKNICAVKYINNIKTDNVVFDSFSSTLIFNSKLQIEIETLCESSDQCCDKLPSNMQLIPNNIDFCQTCPTTTTTTSTTTTSTTTTSTTTTSTTTTSTTTTSTTTTSTTTTTTTSTTTSTTDIPHYCVELL